MTRSATETADYPLEFVNAKLRGRRHRLYEGDRLRVLSQCASVEELAGRLYPRQTVAGRLGLERLLRERCISELTFVLGYLSGTLEQVLSAMLRRFQVDAIVALLRLLAGGEEEAEPERYVAGLPPRFAVSAADLLGSGGVEEFVEKLPVYSPQAAASIDLYRQTGSIAFTEMALQRACWTDIMHACDRLAARWRMTCLGPVLCEIDSARLLAVLRAARNYRLRWEQIEPFLPERGPLKDAAGGFNISNATLRELHKDPSESRLASALPASRQTGVAEDIVAIEETLWKRTMSEAERLFYSTMEGPAVMVGYYYLRRNELKELTGLAEAVHYGREPASRP